MSRIYYAHSGNKTDKSDWQTLSEHLNKASSIAAENARYFDAGILAKNAGLLHDLGKYTIEFQKRLEGGARVDHATAGAKIAVEKWGHYGRLLAYIIAGHHAGLANGIDPGENRSTLDDRLKKTVPELDKIWEEEISLPDQLSFPSYKPTGFQTAFLIRMLFSCLVDADFLDTENFYSKLEGEEKERGNYPSLKKLQKALDTHLEDLRKKASSNLPGTVNDLRQKVLDYSRKQALLPPGLFSLTVPTGGGKTLTSMAFALDHAIKNPRQQLRRVIYVIPFTSIIEQNASVFRDVFKELGDDIVLEHHSAFDDAKFDGREETKDKLKLAMENWDAPVVVTTAVQFFESLFADRTSKCRKLHNITGSVIILDEAQMLPLKLLRPTMAAIDELAKNYQCSVVLCTATQPALLHSDEFYNGFKNVREIAPEPLRLYTDLDRVVVRHIGVQTDVQLAEKINTKDQILVIVNNRRHAHALFEMIGTDKSHYHLTTLMCASHRRKVLGNIRKQLKTGKPCKVISTSLIEAGVDVDFPMVMRAETGLDSVAQAAGRCNREGLNPKEESEVLIFTAPEWKAPPELDQYAASMRYVMRNHEGDLLSPEAINTYFRDVYWRKGDELDAKKLLKIHRDHHAKLTFPFQTIASEYRIIESYMHPVIIPYDKKSEALIKKLRYSEFVGSTARKLQPYLVQVPEQAFVALKSAGAIAPIQPERFGDQFWELINESLYSKKSGMNWDNPYFVDSERSVM